MLLIVAQTKQEQKKTGKWGDQIINDPGTRENTKTRQNCVLMLDFQVAEQEERMCCSISVHEIKDKSTLLYDKYVSFFA